MHTKVQAAIDCLNDYANVPYTKDFRFTLMHLYPQCLALRDDGVSSGYIDSMIFNARLFNTETMTSVLLEHKDSIHFEGIAPQYVRIYCDGSTLIKFNEPVTCNDTQDIFISN